MLPCTCQYMSACRGLAKLDMLGWRLSTVRDTFTCALLPVLQERAAALGIELCKSKRAEQKLQALLFRV